MKYTARFIELAAEINDNMPRFTVSKVQDALNDQGKALKGSRVLILGAAYERDINDLRESPALDVVRAAPRKTRRRRLPRPLYPPFVDEGVTLESVSRLMAEVRKADAVVIITNHKAYDYPAILAAASLIVDTRNALGNLGKANPKVWMRLLELGKCNQENHAQKSLHQWML